MNSKIKGGSAAKTFLKIFAALFILFTLCISALYLFINSSYAPAPVAKIANRAIGREVALKGIEIGLKAGLTLKGLKIKNDQGVMARIETVQIRPRFRGLLKGRFINLYIKKPELFYSALLAAKVGSNTEKGGTKAVAPPSIPFFIRDIVITNLILHRKYQSGSHASPALIGPLTLTLQADSDKKAQLRVKAYIPVLKTSASLDVKLNPRDILLLNGGINLGEIKLKDLKAQGISLTGGNDGALKIGIKFKHKEEGTVRAAMTARFSGITLPEITEIKKLSGVLQAAVNINSSRTLAGLETKLFINNKALKKDGEQIGELEAVYDIRKKHLKIKKAALSAPSLKAGSINLSGSLYDMPGSAVKTDIRIEVKRLRLSRFNNFLLKTLSIKALDSDSNKGLSIDTSIRGVLQEGLRWKSEFTLADSLSYGSNILNLKKYPLRIRGEGIYHRKKDVLELEYLRAETTASGSINLKGSISALRGEAPRLNLTLQGQIPDLSALRQTLRGPLLSEIKIRGSLTSNISIKGSAPSPAARGTLSIKKIFMRGRGIKLKGASLGLGFDYNTSLLTLKKIVAAADSLALAEAKGPAPKLRKISLFIPRLTFNGRDINARLVNLKINKILFIDKKTLFSEENITLKGSIRGDLADNSFSGREFTLSAGPSGGINGEVSAIRLSLRVPSSLSAAIKISGLPVGKFTPLLLGLAGSKAELETSGAMETDIKLRVRDWSQIKADVRLNLKKGAFSAADGDVAAEEIALLVTGRIKAEIAAKKAAFSLKAEAGGFELLAKSFYGSFKERPVKAALQGEYNGSKETLNISSLTMDMPPIGSLKLTGNIASLTTAPRLTANLGPVNISNSESYDFFIANTFSEFLPILERLDVQGRSSLFMRITGTAEDLALKGELDLIDTAVREKKDGAKEGLSVEASDAGGVLLRGVNLTLPINLSYPAHKKVLVSRSGVSNFGKLAIAAIKLGPVEIRDFLAAPIIKNNTLSFAHALKIPLFGGAVNLDNVTFRDLLSPARALTLNMTVDKIDLGRAAPALGLPPFEGTLSALIPQIRLAGNSLTSEGEIELRLFDGTIKIEKISVDNVFSPVAAMKSSIDILDLNLGELTKTFEFGKITGILQGRVENLVIVHGQPESFFIDIHTVKKRGISQRISTKALENVSILGTGAAASVLNRGIYSLFNEYRYKKMGFQGQLNNDELLLLGIETQGDKGYIIKGALIPPRVNVVSFTERISFKEMIKRLKGVNFSSATTEPN